MQELRGYLQPLVPVSETTGSCVRILLITNRDSDNVGDQVIEACDISLIKAAMENLGFSEGEVDIHSKALGIIPNKYCSTNNPRLLEHAESEISSCTFILFGGAPVFNYAYQVFYKKTATILNLAKKFNKPVVFSAVGIDSYDEESEKCQLLKSALHNGTVRQITTRDGIEHLHDYARDEESGEPSYPIALVSDPAVFASTVFSPYMSVGEKKTDAPRIGIFVFRSAGFKDNGISFTLEQQCIFWRDLFGTLNARGFEYEVLTSGHFSDEAMLQYLIDAGIIHQNQCVRILNTPDELLSRISSYDGVITCRLHPSIISFSCDVPSVSIVWNSKVTDFYRHIGYAERAISVDQFIKGKEVDSSVVVDAIEKAMSEGIAKQQDYIESVYQTLLDGIASCLNINTESISRFTDEKLKNHLPRYAGTSIEMEREKIQRKAIRCYQIYNKNQLKLDAFSAIRSFPVIYHNGGKGTLPAGAFDSNASVRVELLQSGNVQYRTSDLSVNDGTSVLQACSFTNESTVYIGWKIRFRVDDAWYWIMNRGGDYIHKLSGNKVDAHLFKPGDTIPHIAVNHINSMVAEAEWCSQNYEMRFNSGRTSGECKTSYHQDAGTIEYLSSGSVELTLAEPVSNLRPSFLLKNAFSYPELEFVGWHIRIKIGGTWYWLLNDGQLVKKDAYIASGGASSPIKLFKDGQEAPRFEVSGISLVVAEATWKAATTRKTRRGLIGRILRRS